MTDLDGFLRAVNDASRRGQGSALAALLALPLPLSADKRAASALLADQVSARGAHGVAQVCASSLADAGLATVVTSRLQALVHLVNNELESAFHHEHAAYNATLDWFQGKDEGETQAAVPLLTRVSDDLRVVAGMAGDAKGDVSQEFLRKALNDLTKGFSAVAKDRTPVTSPGSKKRAILATVNVLFKIYFKVNTLQLCNKIVAVVEGPGHVMGNLEVFPVCDVVTYKYFIGRLKMYEDKYEDARDALRFALKHTPQSALRNRQRILAILVPVEMCLGVLPSPLIATKYGFHPYLRLAEATKRGDLRDFDACFQEHRHVFIRLGVYLVLEQVRATVYRNLFKRFHLISSSTRLSIGAIEAVLRWMGLDTDMDEVECILANLIYQAKVKGYLSHQKRVLVISKADPFPIASVVKKPKTV